MRICVFLGSKPGIRPEYTEQARQLGAHLANLNIGLVYGGASIGLMGEVAKAALDAGGEVIGVIPHRIADMEIAADFITDLKFVDTLEERERLMFEFSDAFVALPGGVGTLEEFFTAVTWNILKYHDKPVGLLNTCGYYDRLFDLLQYQCDEGFIPRNWLEPLVLEENVEPLIEKNYRKNNSSNLIGCLYRSARVSYRLNAIFHRLMEVGTLDVELQSSVFFR